VDPIGARAAAALPRCARRGRALGARGSRHRAARGRRRGGRSPHAHVPGRARLRSGRP
jgi:hypothetical protein